MAEELEKQKNRAENRLAGSGQSITLLRNRLRTANLRELSVARIEYLGFRSGSFLRQCLIRELETGVGFHLIPIVLGLGIGLYFFAPAEPYFAMLCLFVVVLGVAAKRLQSRGAGFYLLSAGFLVLLGMAVAQFSVLRSNVPVLQTKITGEIFGTVLNVERNSKGSPRYLIKVARIEGLFMSQLPERVRLSARSGEIFRPGDAIAGLARMQPVSGPVLPGSYDFGFFSRFDGLGASGFFMGAPMRAKEAYVNDWPVRFEIAINRFRGTIRQRLEAALPGPNGRIVTALVTGDKTGITEQDKDALRASGLAHILAISGLHMALVTLTVIWTLRLALAGGSRVAFRYPTKKIAAVAGFVVATAYLFISGGGVATQRAWIMISVMLLAVLIDRKAITLRSVAISAVLILSLRPQSIFEPGFQMSFAAVTALVVGYEAYYRLQWQRGRHFDGAAGIFASLWRFASGLTLTSLIAGSATLFISAYHFHQIASFGLLANVLAMPIVSVILMPCILLAMLLMPLGFEAIALMPVSHALDAILGIANWVSSLTPLSNVGALQPEMAAVFLTGFIVLLLFRTWLRLAGLAALLSLPLFYEPPRVPDVIVAETGKAAGWRSPTGAFEILFPKRENFVTGIWAKAYAFGTFRRADIDPVMCNSERCTIDSPHASVHIVYDPDLLKASCNEADILIAPRLKWVNCREKMPKRIIKRHDFEQFGSHAIHISPPGKSAEDISIRVETSLPKPNRPWHRNVPDYGD